MIYYICYIILKSYYINLFDNDRLIVPYGDIDNPQGYIATSSHKADKEWSKDEIDVFSEAVSIISLKTE